MTKITESGSRNREDLHGRLTLDTFAAWADPCLQMAHSLSRTDLGHLLRGIHDVLTIRVHIVACLVMSSVVVEGNEVAPNTLNMEQVRYGMLHARQAPAESKSSHMTVEVRWRALYCIEMVGTSSAQLSLCDTGVNRILVIGFCFG